MLFTLSGFVALRLLAVLTLAVLTALSGLIALLSGLTLAVLAALSGLIALLSGLTVALLTTLILLVHVRINSAVA